MTTHLSYSVPEGRRKKRILRIPESQSLYVCPQSCARRQAIRALRNGEADCMAFLQLSQADLVSGDYEGLVGEAVAQLLEALPKPPRVIQVYVNCVDDFVGTDGETLVAGLREQFPDVRFSLSHINPIAVDVQADFVGKMHAGLYGLLEQPARQDAGVSVFGSFEPLPAETELHAALSAAGAGSVRHIAACDTFAEYQQLAASAVALSVARGGEQTARDVAQRFGMNFLSWRPTYSIAEVNARYRELAAALAGSEAMRGSTAFCDGETTDEQALGRGVVADCKPVEGAAASSPVDGDSIAVTEGAFAFDEAGRALWKAMAPVLSPARARAQAAVERALAAVGDTPVIVGADASFAPFDLARELAEYGFKVQRVYGLHLKGADQQAEARLREAFPQVQVVRDENVDAVLQSGVADGARSLGIGADAAFLAGTQWTVDIYHDEGYFGFQGIERLMNGIADAMADAAAENVRVTGSCDTSEGVGRARMNPSASRDAAKGRMRNGEAIVVPAAVCRGLLRCGGRAVRAGQPQRHRRR